MTPHVCSRSCAARTAARDFLTPIGDEQEQRQVRDGTGDAAEEVETGGIGPMEIIEYKHHGTLCRESREKAEHLLEERHLTGNCTDGASVGECGRRGGIGCRARTCKESDSHGP
jgi:hypothetical protein